MTENLINRISFYLASGGLFNPELADHIAVRTLLFECREALAQPWEKFCDSNCVWTDHHPDCKLAEQEPVAYIRVSKTGHVMACAKTGDFYSLPHKTLLYTTPPQRTWVGLTNEEIEQMGLSNYIKVVRETEAKLKEKNT